MTRLSTIDRILSVVDHADFGVILHFRKTPAIDALRTGARSARTLYPVTGSRIDGAYWKSAATPADGADGADGDAGVALSTASDPAREVEAFLNRPFDPRHEAPIQQLLAPGRFLVTRAHHAALDGFSLGLWLQHQLQITAGLEPPATEPKMDGTVRMRAPRHSKVLGGHRPSLQWGSQSLWTRKASGEFRKRWLSIELPGKLSANTLAAATLRTIVNWNRAHGAPSHGMSLWMPVNIRDRNSAGFGNGTSRIRVSMHGTADIRREIRGRLRSGEWAVPADPLLMHLPCVLSNPILRIYLHRPWARMGSAVFSCIEEWPGRDDAMFAAVEKIDLVGQLHSSLPLAINTMTHRGRTEVTITYDASRLSADDVSALASDLAREAEVDSPKRRAETKEVGCIRRSQPTLRGPFNDALRACIGALIHGLGAACSVIHRARIASFTNTQQKLRRRFRIEPNSPVLAYGSPVEAEIRRVASQSAAARWAETSGTTARPKRLLYTPQRIRQTSWTFIDGFVRAFGAYCSGFRSSLYVFRPFDDGDSLTSMLVDEGRVPSYLATLQAPYRVENLPELHELAARYGSAALRLWILAVANPGVLYSTNPSTIALFLDEVASEWDRCRKLIVDFRRNPSWFDPAVHAIAARLQSCGSEERIDAIVSAGAALPLDVWAPAVHTVICWTGGYVTPFLDRLTKRLPPDRYRLVPMYSMSTETIETIGHFEQNGAAFLPLARGVFYEFIEEGLPDSPENLKTAHELEPGKAYTMVVSDAYGLRRYQTDDVFLCAAVVAGLPDLRFQRRRNLEYSFTGEKLSAGHLQSVFGRLRSEGMVPEGAFLAGVPSLHGGDGLPHYKIALVSSECSRKEQAARGRSSKAEDRRPNPEDLSNFSAGFVHCRHVQLDEVIASDCDRMIQEENHEYRRKRETGRLGPAQVLRMSVRDFVSRVGGPAAAADGQFKFLPLYRRLWEELPG
jgi:hypothetical protein